MNTIALAIAALAVIIILRIVIVNYIRKSAQRAAFYKEYFSILNDPQYRTKSNYD